MEAEAVQRIREVLHPRLHSLFQDEVYDCRLLLLKDILHSSGWDSVQQKYEVVAMIMTYWSHGSQPVRGQQLDSRTNIPLSEVDASQRDRLAQADTPGMEAVLNRIASILSVSDGPDTRQSGSEELFESCETNPVFAGTYPECLSCYQEHTD